MAGPTVGILVPTKLTDGQIDAVRRYIGTVVSHPVEGDRFWVSEEPFVIELGPESRDELESYAEAEAYGIPRPRDIIGIYAMCSGSKNHQLLGMLAADVASLTGGMIAFGDDLRRYTSDPEIHHAPSHTLYQSESLLSVELFNRWRAHKDFRMVK